MAKKLYVKLQTPVTELVLNATDAAGVKDSLTVGFKRFTITEADAELKAFAEVNDLYIRMLMKQPRVGDIKEDAEGTEVYSPELIASTLAQLDTFIASSISYIKNASISGEDEEGKSTKLLITDTRSAKPLEDFWESSEECLSVLVGMYLDCTPWKSSLNAGYQKALINTEVDDGGKLKN